MPTVTRSFETPAPLEETWAFLTTPDRVAPCVPGCEAYEERAPDVFDATIGVEVAYTSLTFDARVELAEQDPPTSALLRATAEPAGAMPGSATVEGALSLRATEAGGTAGEVTVDFAIRGRLGSLGESAFAHRCERLTEQFLATVTDELERADAVAG